MAENPQSAQAQSGQTQAQGEASGRSSPERAQGDGSQENEQQGNGHALPSQMSRESMSGTPIFIPPTDIIESKDAFTMLLDMPGTAPDSINVELDGRELTVSGRSEMQEKEGYTLLFGEYQGGTYERVFALSCDIDRDRVDARYKDGVLRLTLPKSAPSPAKKIDVKSG